MAASEANVDFTNVKERSEFNKKRQPEGDYRGKILAVADSPTKEDKEPQWLWTIKVGSGVYPYYTKNADESQFWKIRALLIAAGKAVPKKRVKVNPNEIVGREIGVTLQDTEYNGRAQSEIGGVLPLSELDDSDAPDEDDDDAAPLDDDEDEAPKAKKKAAPKPADDDDDEDEDEAPAGDKFSGLDRTELKQYIAKNDLADKITVKKSMSDDDIRDAIRNAEDAATDDDDLEEIDIDDE